MPKWQRQEIGRSRGGRKTKIHPITDLFCRPMRFIQTGGNVPDVYSAQIFLGIFPSQVNTVQYDKGYDSNAVRSQIESAEAILNISPKSNRSFK